MRRLAVIIAALVVTSGFLYARRGARPVEGGRGRGDRGTDNPRLTAEQREEISAIRDQYREEAAGATAEERRAIQREMMERINRIMAQRRGWDRPEPEMRPGRGRGWGPPPAGSGPGYGAGPYGFEPGAGMMLGMLDLSEEQREAINGLIEEHREKLKADIEAVLTEEQIEKLAEAKERLERMKSQRGGYGGFRGRGLGPMMEPGGFRRRFGQGPLRPEDGSGAVMMRALRALNLTQEQKDAIRAIHQEAREAAEAAETPEERRAIMNGVHEQVLEALTDEQVARLEELRSQRRDSADSQTPAFNGGGRMRGRGRFDGPGGRRGGGPGR